MNNYIVLDGKRYKTLADTWTPQSVAPSSAEIMLDGALSTTYGPVSVMRWSGDIIAPVTPDGAAYGSVADLRTSLLKREQLSFSDHYGTAYTVHAELRSGEKSMGPKWDSPSNEIYFDVALQGVAA